jgi:hypothetical protein
MIQQATSNPRLVDEQIFSERIAFAISAIGTKRTWLPRLWMSVRGGQSRSGVEASMSRDSSNVVLRHMSYDENASLIDMTVQVGFLFFLNANFLPMNQGARSTAMSA